MELYNPGETDVDLTGWCITDTVEDPWSKWKEIPDGTTVLAQGCRLIWGHNKDFPAPGDEKGSHRNIKLLKFHIQSMVKYMNKWGWKFS